MQSARRQCGAHHSRPGAGRTPAGAVHTPAAAAAGRSRPAAAAAAAGTGSAARSRPAAAGGTGSAGRSRPAHDRQVRVSCAAVPCEGACAGHSSTPRLRGTRQHAAADQAGPHLLAVALLAVLRLLRAGVAALLLPIAGLAPKLALALLRRPVLALLAVLARGRILLLLLAPVAALLLLACGPGARVSAVPLAGAPAGSGSAWQPGWSRRSVCDQRAPSLAAETRNLFWPPDTALQPRLACVASGRPSVHIWPLLCPRRERLLPLPEALLELCSCQHLVRNDQASDASWSSAGSVRCVL